MNGPFQIARFPQNSIEDADGTPVATGCGEDEDTECRNAEMICAALNAVFYMRQAVNPKEAA